MNKLTYQELVFKAYDKIGSLFSKEEIDIANTEQLIVMAFIAGARETVDSMKGSLSGKEIS